jgi:hypothetical protein
MVKSLKLLVWILVIVWCLLPPVWLLVTAATNKTTSPPATSNYGYQPPPPTIGQTIGIGGGMVLFMLWMYAIWCASGVVCGIGLERLILAAHEWLGMAGGAIKQWKASLPPPEAVPVKNVV